MAVDALSKYKDLGLATIEKKQAKGSGFTARTISKVDDHAINSSGSFETHG